MLSQPLSSLKGTNTSRYNDDRYCWVHRKRSAIGVQLEHPCRAICRAGSTAGSTLQSPLQVR